ncbi:MAG: nuclease A inhibitor family protein [Adhaeribacter sp.]
MDQTSPPPALAAAAAGLMFISESDYPLEPVVVASAQAASVPAALLQHLGLPPETPVQEQELGYFLRNHTRQDPGFPQEKQQRAQKFAFLQQVLEQELRDLQVYRVGTTQVQAFILGRDARGQLSGLKTTLIET